jgi:hypothetical protein
MKTKIFDRLALILSIAAFFAAAYFSTDVFEGLPHIEDEITYVWQARLAASGKLITESPVCPECFLEPFVIDKDGYRFGKYPPGWPAMLSLGIRLGVRDYLNPFLSTFYVWLAYLLVKKLFDPVTGLISTFLTLFSPFFLMNSGSLLAHPWSLFLMAVFAHGWLDTLDETGKIPKWMSATAAMLSMGLLILTRPLTAVGICLPFFIQGVYLLIKGSARQKQSILAIGSVVAVMSGLYLLWQYRVTGDALQNPYTLYWPYDRIGFGPGYGLHPDGHQLKYAWVNAKFSLFVGSSDLFGWPNLSWLFLPLGVIAMRKNPRSWPVAGVFLSLVLVYGLYWIGSWVFGPRYYYEGLLSLTMLSAAGVKWLSGAAQWQKPAPPILRARFYFTWAAFLLLVCGNLLFYLPMRTESMRKLYGISARQLDPFKTQTALELTPALVIVDPLDYWLEYGVLLDLSSPLLDTPFIFTYDRGTERNRQVIEAFPDRTVIYYNPGDPYTLSVQKR